MVVFFSFDFLLWATRGFVFTFSSSLVAHNRPSFSHILPQFLQSHAGDAAGFGASVSGDFPQVGGRQREGRRPDHGGSLQGEERGRALSHQAGRNPVPCTCFWKVLELAFEFPPLKGYCYCTVYALIEVL